MAISDLPVPTGENARQHVFDRKPFFCGLPVSSDGDAQTIPRQKYFPWAT
ncbi:hypothetical protein [Mycobacterium shottsii]|nr:hypothetical protein [Mycobacterium shottsii]